MPMCIGLNEVAGKWPALIKRIKQGDSIVLEEASQPIARIIPVKQGGGFRTPGTARGLYRMHDDFDAPLPVEMAVQWPSP